MKKLTKKEIKSLKREVKEYGARNVGYYYSIFDNLTFYDTKLAIECLSECGYDISSWADCDRDDVLLNAIIDKMCYQDFKKLVCHFFGYTEYKLINNELVKVM